MQGAWLRCLMSVTEQLPERCVRSSHESAKGCAIANSERGSIGLDRDHVTHYTRLDYAGMHWTR